MERVIGRHRRPPTVQSRPQGLGAGSRAEHRRRRPRARNGLVVASSVALCVMVLSTAAAASALMGQATVEGDAGATTVVGTGNSFGYCTTGRPTTAAAGHVNGNVSLTVGPGACADEGSVGGDHQLPAGTYEVRYTNTAAYTLDDGVWTRPQSLEGHCFAAESEGATTVLGTFEVDAAGNGSWSGRLSPIAGEPQFATEEATQASNLCIGTQDPTLRPPYPSAGGRPGLQVPFRLLPGDPDEGLLGGVPRPVVVALAGVAVLAVVVLVARRRL